VPMRSPSEPTTSICGRMLPRSMALSSVLLPTGTAERDRGCAAARDF
jgi:hypothetical protein